VDRQERRVRDLHIGDDSGHQIAVREIETQATRLRAKNIMLQVMGQTELSTMLKDKPALAGC
jgi:hypothetical protein